MENSPFLTKAKLAEYIERGELVPIGTKVITVQLGECEIYAHNKGRGNNYIYECYNSHKRMSYDKDFKLTIDNAYTSLIDPSPETVAISFTKEELEKIKEDAQSILAYSVDENLRKRQSIISTCNHLLSTPSEFPCKMWTWNVKEENGSEETVVGMFNGKYLIQSNNCSFVSRNHARPIPKVKTLADLEKGDKVWAIELETPYWTKYNKYMVVDIDDSSFCIIDDRDTRHWIDNDKTNWFSLTPPTPAQLTAAKQAAIAEVERRFKDLEKEVQG